MTDMELVGLIARHIAPKPHERESLGEDSEKDFWTIKEARNKARRIIAQLREVGAIG